MKSNIYENLGKDVIGYVTNCPLSSENQQKVLEIQQKISKEFPELLWTPRGDQLHITIMDWIAPLVDYETDKSDFFKKIYKNYDSLLNHIISDRHVFEIKFDKIIALENAILIAGQDDGTINQIRKSFVDKANLDVRTKRPSEYVHSTIARYKKEERLEKINDYLGSIRIDFSQKVDGFRLVKELKVPMIKFEVIKEYKLN